MFNSLPEDMANKRLTHVTKYLVDFVEQIYRDPAERSDAVWKASAAMIGDIGSKITGVGVLFKSKDFIVPFLEKCMSNSATAENGTWAMQMVQKAVRTG